MKPCYASVAQLVEQGTENPRVVGSIPTGGTIADFGTEIHLGFADLAHLVERRLAKAKVAGSSPVIRSKQNPLSKEGGFFCTTFIGNRSTGKNKKGRYPNGIFQEIKGITGP